MKTVIVALFVLLVVSQSEALRCYCRNMQHCTSDVETCLGLDNVCASAVVYSGYRDTYLRGCVPASRCRLMDQPGISSIRCCYTDRCNS